jgi:hypothetical protein
MHCFLYLSLTFNKHSEGAGREREGGGAGPSPRPCRPRRLCLAGRWPAAPGRLRARGPAGLLGGGGAEPGWEEERPRGAGPFMQRAFIG